MAEDYGVIEVRLLNQHYKMYIVNLKKDILKFLNLYKLNDTFWILNVGVTQKNLNQ